MIDGLLQTKLYRPASRSNWVARPRLLAKLKNSQPCKLVLVSAQAGYGKTTLITAWLEQVCDPAEIHVGWISLDEDDSEPQQFFRYLVAAIEPLPVTQTSVLRLLKSGQKISSKELMKAFISDVSTVSEPHFLVLEDYHRVDSAEIDMALATLLDYMPPQMTLVITSRTDPGFPISRLRARQELVEIRADDLRFTRKEAAEFFQQSMGKKLTPDQIKVLEDRTEGWITGLQMAALSFQNRTEAGLAEFVSQFSGSHRFVLDFLAEEVLAGLPDGVREFLLDTAILDRLSGPICDALTGRNDAQQILEELEHSNLFLIPLDQDRTWYRYHHLFADVLKAHNQSLRHEAEISALHSRASEWYVQNGSPVEAIRHALTAEDFELAANQIELIWRSMDRSFQEATWLSWAQALPDELIRMRPVLCVGYAWALLDTGQIEAAEPLLDEAERWLEAPSAEMVVVDKREFASLPSTIAAARAYLAQATGDLIATIRYAQQTLDLLPEDEHFYRGIPSVTMGLAQWANGELDAAFASVTDAVVSFQLANNFLFALSGRNVLAQIKISKGQLHEAVAIFTQALQQMAERGEPQFGVGTVMHRGLCAICYEQGELEAAKKHLEQCQTLIDQAGIGENDHQLFVMQAKIKRAEGDFDSALALLGRGKRAYSRGRLPEIAPISAIQSRMWIANNQLVEAQQWASDLAINANDELSYLREYEYLTLARLLIAQFRQSKDASVLDDAQKLLARLLAAAENDGRMGSMLETYVVQSLADALSKSGSAWQLSLRQALTLALPQGFLRLFVDEGVPMQQLFEQLVLEKPTQRAYRDRVLAAFKAQSIDKVKPQPLVDPLSERELEILNLVAAGFKNKEIAEELVISLNTVLYHTKNIYGKLGVNKRAIAIAKAHDLDLI